MKTTVHCIKHQRDLHALSTLYPVYCTVLSFEAWLHHEIIIYNTVYSGQLYTVTCSIINIISLFRSVCLRAAIHVVLVLYNR